MIEYQRVIAEIDLDAIASNMKNIRNITNKNTKIMGIVKADAYGHGAVEVAKVLLYNGAACLGVAILDEGIQLRKNNIHVPILILGYTPETKMEDVIKYDIIQTIFSYEAAYQLSVAAVKLNKIAKIHIKIDTGMGRIGFLPNEAAMEEIIKIHSLPNIEIDGIYTHFSTADEFDKSFTIKQLEIFKNTVESLEQKGIFIPTKHCANSAAIMDLNNAFFNMVRPGIILYGMYPSDEVKKEKLDLIPAMSIKTHISYVKKIEEGTPIGYGRTFTAKRESKIATVPIGYADGFQRVMTKGGRVIVGGGYAPVVGRICMDQFMIDVTEIGEVKAGDEVIILGKKGKNEISAEEIATITGTINYEIVCMIGKRVPREYIKNKVILKTVQYIG